MGWKEAVEGMNLRIVQTPAQTLLYMALQVRPYHFSSYSTCTASRRMRKWSLTYQINFLNLLTDKWWTETGRYDLHGTQLVYERKDENMAHCSSRRQCSFWPVEHHRAMIHDGRWYALCWARRWLLWSWDQRSSARQMWRTCKCCDSKRRCVIFQIDRTPLW